MCYIKLTLFNFMNLKPFDNIPFNDFTNPNIKLVNGWYEVRGDGKYNFKAISRIKIYDNVEVYLEDCQGFYSYYNSTINADNCQNFRSCEKSTINADNCQSFSSWDNSTINADNCKDFSSWCNSIIISIYMKNIFILFLACLMLIILYI